MTLRTSGPPTLVGVPYDASSSFERGAAEAPALIREQMASPAGNHFSEDLRDLGAEGAVRDAGDLTLPASAEARAAIEAGIARIVAGGGDRWPSVATTR